MSESRTPWVDGLTIGQVLRATAARVPDREAVVFPELNVRVTWRQFDQDVDRGARALLACGLKPGDHFGVWATNWPEWVLLQFATARIGVVLVTINPAYRAEELAYAMAQSDIVGLALLEQFKTSHFFEMLGGVCPELNNCRPGQLDSKAFPRLKWVIGLRAAEHPGTLSWSSFLQLADSVSVERLSATEQSLAPGDPINLQYTSGTTGFPKGAVLTHRNLLLNAYYAAECQRLTDADRMCLPVPLYHCFGCVLGSTCAVVAGAAMVFPHESFHPAATLNAIEQERCTVLYGVPTMFIAQLEHSSYAPGRTASLRTGIMAGSPCPVELMKRVVSDMGASEITIGYGQTEASPLITQTRTDDPLDKRVRTVGQAFPDIDVKIVDFQTGQTLPDGQSGELCCRGHNVMLGYYNMPDRTAQAIDADGWLHTGDMALRQPDGYFRITGRFKDLIIRGGENIAPREIEELLYRHPKVEDVQVIGVPDRKFGEEVAAWVKLRSGESATEAEIRAFCQDHLAHFKVPRYVKFVDSFPTTVTGKIQKFKMREQAIVELGLSEVAAVETA